MPAGIKASAPLEFRPFPHASPRRLQRVNLANRAFPAFAAATLLFVAIGLSACSSTSQPTTPTHCIAVPASAKAERVATATPWKTPAGNALVVPGGWAIFTQGNAIILEAPEAGSCVAIFDLEAETADEAVAMAWNSFKVTAHWTLKSVTPAIDKDGWTERKIYSYQGSPSEGRDVEADVRRANSMWTIVISDIDHTVAQSRPSEINLILDELVPEGYERNSYANTKRSTSMPEGAPRALDKQCTEKYEKGETSDALEICQQSVNLYREALRNDPKSPQRKLDLNGGLTVLGDIQLKMADFAAARSTYMQSHRITTDLTSKYKNDAKLAPLLENLQTLSLEELGDVDFKEAKFKRAAARYEEAVKHARHIVSKHRKAVDSELLLADALMKAGDAQSAMKHDRPALRRYQECLAIRREYSNRESPHDQLMMIDILARMNDAARNRAYAVEALQIATDMKEKGTLPNESMWMIDDLRKRAGH